MSDTADLTSYIIKLTEGISTANTKLDNINDHLKRNDVAFIKVAKDIDDIEKKLQEVEASLKTLKDNVEGIKEEKKAKKLAREALISWIGGIVGGCIVLFFDDLIEWWGRQ